MGKAEKKMRERKRMLVKECEKNEWRTEKERAWVERKRKRKSQGILWFYWLTEGKESEWAREIEEERNREKERRNERCICHVVTIQSKRLSILVMWVYSAVSTPSLTSDWIHPASEHGLLLCPVWRAGAPKCFRCRDLCVTQTYIFFFLWNTHTQGHSHKHTVYSRKYILSYIQFVISNDKIITWNNKP